MRKQKHKVGSFLGIELADGSFGYCRVLERPYAAFYRYRTKILDFDLDQVASQPILFRTAVRQQALDAWMLIGCKALEAHLSRPIVQFMQDIVNFRDCTIFDTTGYEEAVKPEQCVGLECAAVWEKKGIEERLLDSFMDRPNAEVERLKVRLK